MTEDKDNERLTEKDESFGRMMLDMLLDISTRIADDNAKLKEENIILKERLRQYEKAS